jgi:type IV pilus assembly protein PilQ
MNQSADPKPFPNEPKPAGQASIPIEEPTVAKVASVPAMPAKPQTTLVAESLAQVPASSHQDTAPVLGTVDPRANRTMSQPSPGSGGGASGLGKPMNLDVQNADVRTVFRSISEFSGVNIVPDRDVVGPVSIRLNQVPWRQALDIVSQSAGLTVVPANDVLRVATLKTFNAEELERESQARRKEDFLPLQTHVFKVGYASASELVGAVGLVLSERGTVNFDSRTNALIVSDISPRIDEASSLIRSLDSETQQVEIVARLVDMDRGATRRLGVTWNADNLGDADEGFSASGLVDEALPSASGQMRLGLIRSWGNLDATLEAFEQENQAHIISNPKIMTVNNHPAEILVGREIPLITLDEAGNPVTELKKVGIALRCTPYINADGRITMDLHPEISDLSSQATVQGGLIFTTSEAQTRIMVEDGQTAVIGGLVRSNETEFEQGVPILREIPFLGHLFKSTDRVIEERELLIFVTPRIVTTMASNEG